MLVYYQWPHILNILRIVLSLILTDGQKLNLMMHLFPFLMEKEIALDKI